MDLNYAFDFLKRRWWLLFLATLLAAGSAYYFSKQITPIYRATTTVLVNQSQSRGVIQYNDVLTSERLTSTYAELAKRRSVLSEVRRRLSLSTTESELRDKVSVSPVRNTQLLRISVEDPDPSRAANIADTTARAFIDQNSTQLGNEPGTISIAEQAEIPPAPVKPNVKLNTALAAMLGLMIGGVIALILEYLDDTVKTSQDVEALAGLTTLGTVTRFRSARQKVKWPKARPAAPAELAPEFVEDFRQIRTNIHFGMLRQGPKSILITSAYPGEGKTTTAANLAIVLAQAGHSVILVDTDLRRPSLHSHFGTPNSFGLTGLLLSQIEHLDSALMKTAVSGLRVLTSGPLPPNPSELLMSPEVHKILGAIKARADYVILDSPPLLAVTDARLLADQADATVVVVERGKTRSEAFQRACESLGQTNAKIIGVVINKLKTTHRAYYSYAYSTRGTDSQTLQVKPAQDDPRGGERVGSDQLAGP